MVAYDLVEGIAWSPAKPCQGGVSASGERFTINVGGHRNFRVFPRGLEYQEFTNGDTYNGCGPDTMCPGLVGCCGLSGHRTVYGGTGGIPAQGSAIFKIMMRNPRLYSRTGTAHIAHDSDHYACIFA